jgi:uncharacterized protein YecT (DUF1311 family)
MRGAALALAAFLPTTALAQPVGGCDPATLHGPALSDCLTAADKRSADALQATFQAALGAIATRAGVFDAQRARWKNSLTESQEFWLRFRNAECQNVAPFEGQTATLNVARNRMAAYEAKLVCSTRLNEARRADLATRYGEPSP